MPKLKMATIVKALFLASLLVLGGCQSDSESSSADSQPQPTDTSESDTGTEGTTDPSTDDDTSESSGSTETPFGNNRFTAVAGDRSITLEWEPISEASQYNLYQATEPFDDFQNYAAYQDAALTLDVSNAHSVQVSTNYLYHYFVLTAEVDGQEYPVGEPLSSYAVSSTEPSEREVRYLELLNRARKNPTAEADRYGLSDLNDDLEPGTISSDPKPPVAFNIELMNASRTHSDWMLQNNIFSHTGANGSTPRERAEAAGYPLTSPSAIGENLAWTGITGSSTIDLTDAIEQHHEGLFLSSGHRTNILNDFFREVGVGQRQGYFTYNGVEYYSSMLTNLFGASVNRYFLTGVAFEVTDEEGLFQPGSSLDDVVVQVGNYRYAPYASGAYNIMLPPGSYPFSVTVAGTLVESPEVITLTDQNMKRDVISQSGSVSIRAY
ncbi:MAG: CAP domain-containing protein [Pseudomonadota bacterium]